MKGYHYVGFDVHKKTISFCVKRGDGEIVAEGVLNSNRAELAAWAQSQKRGWIGGLEATLFTGWVYDALRPFARELKVGHSYQLRLISGAKKKTDRLDARKLADLLRCNLFPECYMPAPEVRELRRVLRYRNLLVREASRMKNKTSSLLLEVGAEHNKSRLHGKRYFEELLGQLQEVPESVLDLLRLTRSNLEVFTGAQRGLLRHLEEHPALAERVQRLTSIPGVGVVTALTWSLEIDDPHRFSSYKKAISYCGLCSALSQSADKTRRGPLSKQRNKHLQSMLVEAAKLAPRRHPQLAAVYEKERARGANWNQATLAVARKLVSYLLCVDKSGKEFVVRSEVETAA